MAKSKHQTWFICLLGISAILYTAALQHKTAACDELMLTLKTLNTRKENALRSHDDLLLQINSQSDPAWVEMVLKRNLGMVSEGQIKVYFE